MTTAITAPRPLRWYDHLSINMYTLGLSFASGSLTPVITPYLVALFVPAAYIAMTNYHQEMIPTDLLMAIAASRQGVPFPVPVEVILMEVSFELIREAGVRIPNVIGPTIGIVGALVLGQAAVAANIVSPILVIIIAVTGLATFTIPNFSASFAVRVLRFPFEILAAVLGFPGMAAGILITALHLASIRSFGVPFLSPVAPRRTPTADILARGQLWEMWHRPPFLRQRDKIRQDLIVRKWAPGAQRTKKTPKNPKGAR